MLAEDLSMYFKQGEIVETALSLYNYQRYPFVSFFQSDQRQLRLLRPVTTNRKLLIS